MRSAWGPSLNRALHSRADRSTSTPPDAAAKGFTMKTGHILLDLDILERENATQPALLRSKLKVLAFGVEEATRRTYNGKPCPHRPRTRLSARKN